MVASPDIELSIETGFISFFNRLPEDQSLIRLFDRSRTSDESFFTAHGKDALWVADNVYGTTTVLKYYGNGSGQTPSVSLKQATAIEMIKDLLLKRNFKVEIWESSGSQSFKIAKSASPGNLREMDDLLFLNSDLASAPVVCSIWVESKADQKIVGVAFLDNSSGQHFMVSQFQDDGETFSNLESLLIQQGVKECLIQKETTANLDFKKIYSILDRCEILCTQVKSGLFNSSNIVQDLNRLLETELDALSLPEMALTGAMKCTSCLISYLGLLTEDANMSSFSMTQYDLSQYMKLDSSAAKALNLTPGPKEGGNKTTNLFGLLNKCKTAQGSRLLGQWIKQPLTNIQDIKTRQNIVSIFFDNTYLLENIQATCLQAFPDLHRLAKKFQRGKGSLQDVIRIYQVVSSIPLLLDLLTEYEGDNKDLLDSEFIKDLTAHSNNLEKLKELVETTIDLRASDHHEYVIKADFDPTLNQVRSKMETALRNMKAKGRDIADRLNIEFEKKLKFEHNPQFGYHLRLFRNDASKIRNDSEFKTLKTVKAGVLFTTTAIKRLAEEHSELERELASLQSETAKEVISITKSYFPILELVNQIVARLDVFLSLAEAATKAPTPYICPEIQASGDLILKGSRHPCVEMQDDVCFIENDASLTRSSFFDIITGPNMGGKSTFIRQIGVIVLMAQIGSRVPATEASIPIIDSILARVGAGDSQLLGISTFMAEMLETAAILRAATSRSLIIIDELGRGTSTKDGFGLAWAIAEHIAKNVSSYTLFATHFHEITTLADSYPGVKNSHVQALISSPESETKTLTLLYKVLPGVCDQSFGIHVAELANFPQKVIQMAKRKAAELEGFNESSKKKWLSEGAVIHSGGALIQDFLQNFAQLPAYERETGLLALKEQYQLQFSRNAFVQEVLNEF